MSKAIEKIINDYPSMLREQALLANQILGFKGLSQMDMIESMSFSQPTGERVQTSGLSEKTARIAISYESRITEMNREWIKNLEMEYSLISEEIIYFNSAVDGLEPKLSELMKDLVLKGMQWDEVIKKHHISKTMFAKNRRKALAELEKLYAIYNEKMINFIFR